jgi:hypothetical protein
MAQKVARPVCGDRATGNHGYAGKRPFTRLNYATQVLARLRRQRYVEQICQAPRLVFELIEEIKRHHPTIADDVDARLERYASVNRHLLAAVGGDRFPAMPLRVIGGGS